MIVRVVGIATLGLLLLPAQARAEALRKVVPAGGGLGALELVVHEGAGKVTFRTCARPDCADAATDASTKGEVDLAKWSFTPDPKAATIEVVSVGEGRSVGRVRIPSATAQGAAFEVVVSAKSPEPIFAGVTGYGSEGSRSGQAILLLDRDPSSKVLVVADVNDRTRICGQAWTPLASRGLDPKRMELRGASFHRIDKKARESASTITATPRRSDAQPVLGRILEATGGSSPGAERLTDGDAATTWAEDRSGDGHGEFVTMQVPKDVPIEGFVLTLAPREPKSAFASPSSLFLATDDTLYRVELPNNSDTIEPISYDVALPAPAATSCVAVVLDEAYTHGTQPPIVRLAEARAWTSFDREGTSLAALAKELGGPRHAEAGAILAGAGAPGVDAIEGVFASLDSAGRMRALEVASRGTCESEGTVLAARALADRDAEVRRKGLSRVERCGKASATALAKVVREGTEDERKAAAPYLAMVAPASGLGPLGDKLGEGSAETRQALRGAFGRAAASRSRAELLPILAAADARPATARMDLLRALGPRIVLVAPEATQAIDRLLRETPTPATRYLLAGPIAELSRAEPATSASNLIVGLVRRDPEWFVRARAVEMATKNPQLAKVIAEAASDPHPRVREAAFVALRELASPLGKQAVASAIASDEWTFVRAAAFDALTALPRDPKTDAILAQALEDKNPLVRLASVNAASKLRVSALGDAIVERLDDREEYLEVRVAAARALGAICMHSAADRLTELSERAKLPVDAFDDRIGFAAIEALGTLHPADLAARLAPLREKGVRAPARLAADRALAAPSGCK